MWRAGPTVPLPRFLLQATAGSDSAVACQRLQSIVTHTASLVLEADLRSGLCHPPPEVRTWDAEPANSLDLASSVPIPEAGAPVASPGP